jgi:hypothetical protein
MRPESGRPGELLFERYLAERGYPWEHHPKLDGVDTRPDYLARVDDHTIVCEVKSFDTAGAFATKAGIGVAVGGRSMKEALAPHRNDIRAAAKQLKPLRDRGWPLVVVLSNPRGCVVPTDPMSIIAAMYGDPELVAPWREDGSLGDFTAQAGRNGKLRNDHPYLSAVIMLHCQAHAADWSARWIAEHRPKYPDVRDLTAAFLKAAHTEAPEGEDVFVDVFETFSDSAVPLPRSVFDGPRDRRFAPNDTRTAIIQLPCVDTE